MYACFRDGPNTKGRYGMRMGCDFYMYINFVNLAVNACKFSYIGRKGLLL